MRRYRKLTESEYKFKLKSDLPLFQDMMENPAYFERRKGMTFEIEQMSPDAYFSEIRKFMHSPMTFVDMKIVHKYADMIREGKDFYIPHIEYFADGDASQEGRHRVLAMKELGVKRIDVLIVKHKW